MTSIIRNTERGFLLIAAVVCPRTLRRRARGQSTAEVSKNPRRTTQTLFLYFIYHFYLSCKSSTVAPCAVLLDQIDEHCDVTILAPALEIAPLIGALSGERITERHYPPDQG